MALCGAGCKANAEHYRAAFIAVSASKCGAARWLRYLIEGIFLSRPLICYVITNADAGGAQTHLRVLLDFVKHEYDIALATGTQGPLTEEMGVLGVPYCVLPDLANSLSPLSLLRAVMQVRRWVRELQPSILHAHSSKAGLVARLAARQMPVRIVYTAHGWGFKPGVPPLRRLLVYAAERLTLKGTDTVICVSKHDFELGIRTLPALTNKLRCIPNGIPDAICRAHPEGSPIKIVMVARFQHPKDQDFALKAFAMANVDAQLVFVGDGPNRGDVEAQVLRNWDLRSRVDFYGERLDVQDILAKCHIFLLFSRHEGLPMGVLEAMRAGLPVVASDVGGIGEAVTNKVSGFLVQHGALASAAQAIRQLTQDPELRSAMGAAARRAYEARFTQDEFGSRTLNIYRALLEGST